MSRFYVYKHVKLTSNTTFYVGKGCGKRAYDRAGRNNYWNNIADKHGYKVVIVAQGLNEDAAYRLETSLIAIYRRHSRCEANLDLGGSGGKTMCEESRRKMSQARAGKAPWNKGIKGAKKAWNKGRAWPEYVKQKLKEIRAAKSGKWATFKAKNTGIPMSQEQKLKVAETKKLRHFQVIEESTGRVIWEGLFQLEAIKALGLTASSKGNVNMCLKGLRKTHKGFTFRYTEEAA